MDFESEILPTGNPDSGKKQHALGVSFQEVVHPVLSEEAEVVEALANPGRTEWTPIRMRR
jgi:hypothetical protein